MQILGPIQEEEEEEEKEEEEEEKEEEEEEDEEEDKSSNLFKFVSVLISASVERVGVSRMRDFLYKTCIE